MSLEVFLGLFAGVVSILAVAATVIVGSIEYKVGRTQEKASARTMGVKIVGLGFEISSKAASAPEAVIATQESESPENLDAERALALLREVPLADLPPRLVERLPDIESGEPSNDRRAGA